MARGGLAAAAGLMQPYNVYNESWDIFQAQRVSLFCYTHTRAGMGQAKGMERDILLCIYRQNTTSL